MAKHKEVLEKPGGLLGQRARNLSDKTKFILTTLFALLWASLALFLALPWIRDLGEIITLPLAILIVFGLAVVPGYLAAFLITSILLDKPEKLPPPLQAKTEAGSLWPAVTVLIAAHNEEHEIGATLLHILEASYFGKLEIIVIDDGSDDRTAEMAENFKGVEVISVKRGGKPAALNQGLKRASHDLVLSLDADTVLTPQAIERLVSRLEKEDAVAAAGAVMVLNSHDNWLTRMQQWDYQMGIASIKKSQALWKTTSVAQGAFSLYRKKELLESGGWQEMVGEDIVLTWSFLEHGYRVDFEPTAISFTRAPRGFRGFIRQRSRWARGMLEGLREHGAGIVRNRRLATHGVVVNSLFPLVDATYTLAFIPGVFMALAFSNYAVVGPMTLLVIPLNLIIFLIMHFSQKRVFKEVGVRLHKNRIGFLAYLLFYQALVAPISLVGYLEELLQRQKVWRASNSRGKQNI